MSLLAEAQIEAAVDWWAEQIQAPRFSGLSDAERQDPRNRDYQFAEVLAGMVAAQNAPSQEQIERFKVALADLLRSKPTWGSIGVDYGPDSFLAEAAQKAGISVAAFPWKTTCYFFHGGVEVQAGYSAPRETLLTEEPGS